MATLDDRCESHQLEDLLGLLSLKANHKLLGRVKIHGSITVDEL